MFILVINNKEIYLVDKTNADKASTQFLEDERLNFSHYAWNPFSQRFTGYDLRIMSIKNSFVTHLEIREAEDDTQQGRKHQ